jgi:xanthine/uracil permease
MSSYDDSRPAAGQDPEQTGSPARVGTVVWGLTVVALAALLIISRLGILALNGTYVLIGLMIGAGAALIIGGLVSARKRDKNPTTGKS